MLMAEELPAGVTDLDTGLTDVDGNDFTHFDVLEFFVKEKRIIKLSLSQYLNPFIETPLN